ncbi:DMT family transporter [Actinoplanes sp. NPDC049596]|uniref:DMT family transporter n=1 Tax=unclassified Actinoplanes TaxID=2626549 RepID=UPI003442B27E
MASLGWAVVLSVLSAGSYAAAAVAQERLAKHGQRGLSRWVIALMLTGGGAILHLVALDFGTVAVVQALGTLTLLFALPIARVRYGVRLSAAAWADAMLTVAGLALIMSLSVESDRPAVLAPGEGLDISLITVGAVGVLALLAWRVGARLRGVLLAAAAGIAFGISSLLAKAVIGSLTGDGLGSVSTFLLALVIIFGAAGYLLGQLSYRGAGLAAPLATVSVANPIVAAFAGVLVFDEGFRFGATGLVVVALAGLVMTAGVIGLARRTAAPPSAAADAPGELSERSAH